MIKAIVLVSSFILAQYIPSGAHFPVSGGGGGATFTVVNALSTDSTTTASFTATTAGDNLVVCIGYVSVTNQILTLTDNATGGSNTYSIWTASQSLNVAATLANQCYDTLGSAHSGATILTITGLSSVFANINFYQLHRNTGTWTRDVANGITTGIGTGTNIPGPALAMTGSTGIAVTGFVVNDFITVNPAAGSLWTVSPVLSTGSNNGANAIITASAGTQTSAVTDNSSVDTYAASGVSYK